MSTYPSFLHECYRHATSVLGLAETTKKSCERMEVSASENYKDCPDRGTLTLSKYHFWKFFFMFGGKLYRPITKPRLTTEHIRKRLEFANKWLSKLNTGDKLYYVFLDEKWLYMTSRHK